MKSFLSLLYLCQAVLAGNLYSPTSYAYPASTLVAPQPVSPLHYASPLRTSTGYGPLALARVGQIASPMLAPAPLAAAPGHAVYTAPTAYSAPVIARYPVPTAYSAPVAPVIQKYAAVPAVADVPITRYEARPGFIQKYYDVAHPKVATTKLQIRRPAIQKQFYDIEERIVVRPVASAVLELDQPISKSQAGPTVVGPALPVAPGLIPAAPLPPVPAYSPPQPLPPPSAPANPQYPSPSAPENPQFPPPSAPENPQFQPSGPQNPQFPPSAPQFPEVSAPDSNQESDDSDSDSITVENEDVRARTSLPQQTQARQPQTEERNQPQTEERNQPQNEETRSEPQPEQPQARANLNPTAPQQFRAQTEARFLSRSQDILNSINNFPSQARFSGDVIPSSRSQLTEEQSLSNQQRLIELLTGRGGIAEVRSGVTIDAAGEAGQIRGTVLSVTPAPPSSDSANERVSTRRIVVNRPIQTLQEVDVVQPFTKIHRLAVQHPAILKTPRVDIARVRTVAPVPVTTYGAYAPYTYLH